MKDGLLVTELRDRLRKTENEIEAILVKLISEGIIVRGIGFTPYGKTLESDSPGYGFFVPKISITIDL